MAAESTVQAEVWLGLARRAIARVTLFRTNSGKGWLSNLGPKKGIGRLPDGSVVIRAPRPMAFGLAMVNGDTAPGLSDLTGWTEVVITPEMVGRKVPIFTVIETKESTGGRKAENQISFVKRVHSAGGIAGFASSLEQGNEIIDAWLEGRTPHLG